MIYITNTQFDHIHQAVTKSHTLAQLKNVTNRELVSSTSLTSHTPTKSEWVDAFMDRLVSLDNVNTPSRWYLRAVDQADLMSILANHTNTVKDAVMEVLV